jgi:hypothetical protein
MTSTHKVILILDKYFGKQIIELALEFHCWLVESPENLRYKDEVWEKVDKQSDPLETGITIFKAMYDDDEASIIDIIETIMDHHSEFEHTPGLNVLEVIGVGLTQKQKDELRLYGFSEFKEKEGGYVAKIVD